MAIYVKYGEKMGGIIPTRARVLERVAGFSTAYVT